MEENKIQLFVEKDQFNPTIQGVRFTEGDYDFGIWDIQHTTLRSRSPDSLKEEEILLELVNLILRESDSVKPFNSLFELGLHKTFSAP